MYIHVYVCIYIYSGDGGLVRVLFLIKDRRAVIRRL